MGIITKILGGRSKYILPSITLVSEGVDYTLKGNAAGSGPIVAGRTRS